MKSLMKQIWTLARYQSWVQVKNKTNYQIRDQIRTCISEKADNQIDWIVDSSIKEQFCFYFNKQYKKMKPVKNKILGCVWCSVLKNIFNTTKMNIYEKIIDHVHVTSIIRIWTVILNTIDIDIENRI